MQQPRFCAIKKPRRAAALGVRVLDLECDADIALGVACLDNDTDLRPTAALLDIHIGISRYLLGDLGQDGTEHRIRVGVVCGHSDGQVFLVLAFNVNFADQFMTKDADTTLEILIQMGCSDLLQVFIILQACGAGALAADLAHYLFLGCLILAAAATAGTGSKHQHGHCACKQQSDDL